MHEKLMEEVPQSFQLEKSLSKTFVEFTSLSYLFSEAKNLALLY